MACIGSAAAFAPFSAVSSTDADDESRSFREVDGGQKV